MRRAIVVLAVLTCSLFAVSSAYAFDCIRVSTSHQGSVQSANHSGRWLLIDLSTTEAAAQTLATIGVHATPAQVACFTDAYGRSGQPLTFTLGIGVAGPNGVLAHNNPNTRVVSNGHGIDHIEDSPISAAVDASAMSCGFSATG
jgi:hypothetical protein